MATKAAIEDFDVEELCDFVALTGNVFEGGLITQYGLYFDLDATDLKELFPLIGDRKVVQKLIASYHLVKENVRTDHCYVAAKIALNCFRLQPLRAQQQNQRWVLQLGLVLVFPTFSPDGSVRELRKECLRGASVCIENISGNNQL